MLPNLERFYVVSSRLKHIFRRNFFHLRKLKFLDLRFNELVVIPDDGFIDLFDLELLNLSGNLIKKLPSNFLISNIHLQYFEAGDNEITEFNDEIFHHNLHVAEFLMHNNRLKRIEINLWKFRQLEFVDFRGNECINAMYYKGHPNYSVLRQLQKEIIENCTMTAQLKQLNYRSSIEGDELCEKLALPSTKKCRTGEKS